MEATHAEATDDLARSFTELARILSPFTLELISRITVAARRGDSAGVRLWRDRQTEWTRAIGRVRAANKDGSPKALAEIGAAVDDALSMWRRWK